MKISRKGVTKDLNGVPFRYKFYGECKWIFEERSCQYINKYSVRIYSAIFWPEITAKTLYELKEKVTNMN